MISVWEKIAFLNEIATISVRENITVYLHIFGLPLTHKLGLREAPKRCEIDAFCQMSANIRLMTS